MNKTGNFNGYVYLARRVGVMNGLSYKVGCTYRAGYMPSYINQLNYQAERNDTPTEFELIDWFEVASFDCFQTVKSIVSGKLRGSLSSIVAENEQSALDQFSELVSDARKYARGAL